MRRRRVLAIPILAAATFLITGCSKAPRDKLQGRWEGESISAMHPSQSERAQGWVKGTHLEFSGNKVTVSIPAESPRTGTFRVEKAEGDTMDVVFKRSEGGEDRSKIRMTDDGKLVWALNGGVELTMKRMN
ncbi:MAG: hypothetical protein U0271_23565 [Polyangiaceae bacterium]